MQEVEFGSNSKISITIYRNGVETNADGTVTLSFYDATDTTNTLITTGSAVNEQPLGVYDFEIGPSITSMNRTLKVVWAYSINSASTTQTTFVNVVTPYATVSDIIDYYGIGPKPSDPNFFPQTKLKNLEKIARTVINGYTGQQFGARLGSQELFSYGSDAVFLTEPMLTINQVYEDDNLVIDYTASPVFNQFGFDVEITDTGKVVRIVNVDWDVRYDNQVDPTILYYGKFRDGSRYRFSGVIGWQFVPQDIKLAALLLVGDYMSNDSAWRVKYLTKVAMSETSFEMAPGAFNGTGNLLVDNILDSYRNTGIVII